MSLCASVYMCFVVTCWERADLLALVCGVYCEFVTFPLVSWVRCGTWLYRFLIFAPLLTSNNYLWNWHGQILIGYKWVQEWIIKGKTGHLHVHDMYSQISNTHQIGGYQKRLTNTDQKSLETVFLIAICCLTFDLRSTIVLTFSIDACRVCNSSQGVIFYCKIPIAS